MKPAISRKLAVITGGCGGIGLACARAFGTAYDLVLMDLSAEKLAQTTVMLSDEGFVVRYTIGGDLASEQTLDAMAACLGDAGCVGVVIHTAGMSSGMAPWDAILRTNVLGTKRLMDRIAPFVGPGTVAVLVASIAGHLAPRDDEIDALLGDCEAADFMARMERVLTDMVEQPSETSFNYSGLSGPAYGLSKRYTIRLAASCAPAWAERGGRVVSISPGIIYTPMGRYEVEHGEAAANVLAETAMKRWGMPTDIAQAALFLASDKASFITGTDLRVDGGMIPVRLGANNW